RQRRRVTTNRHERSHSAAHKFGCHCGQTVVCATSPTELNCYVLAFDQATLAQASPECGEHIHGVLRRPTAHKSDHWLGWLLCTCRERPRRHATEQRDELASLHSITSSASASSLSGIWRPRAFAVLRLITSSNLVGCSTGRSPGFSPFRM